MTTFYFVRHGETLTNRAQCFNGGGIDTALTVAGEAAAVRLGAYLAQQSFDAIVSSPLQRAQTTAKLLLQPTRVIQPAIQIDDRLKEMALGDWEGQPVAAQRDHPEIDHYFHRPDLFDAAAIHAETYQSVLDRSQAVIADYEQAYPDGQVLIVAHGIVLLFLMNTLLGVPFAEIRNQKMVANASLSILTEQASHYQKKLWNQTMTED